MGAGRARSASERGQSLVEFALLMPLLIVLLVGLFDAARAVWLSNTLATASREGTRYAIVHGAASDLPSGPGSASYTPPDQDSGVTTVVDRYAIGVTGLTVRSTWLDGNNSRGSRVKVEASAPFAPVLSQAFIGAAFRVTLRSGSEMVIHR